MNSNDNDRLLRLFAEAAEMGPDERVRFLEKLSGPDLPLRAELESLLEADGASARDLPFSQSQNDLPKASIPDRIGSYRVRGVLGEGGMGVVYSAESFDRPERPVALKLLRRDLVCSTTIARFAAERDALSVMDHPNVARVYESGATDDGRLYIAMESVPGVAIHAFCDARRLDVQARLDLFLQVCDGVQHAHERGVIHRDLSPGNVLVTMDGDRPQAKIIDFGIAKFLVATGSQERPQTAAGILIGTPEYLSPEQLALRPGAGDTRTDVWALGLMLYELLVGVLPYDDARLRQGIDGLRAAISQPLPSPRERLRSLPEARAESIARDRATDRRSLSRRVKGDLGHIAMKALARDRAQRYPSPNDLADDIRRHLRLEPVEAGPPGAVYRIGRFVRRRSRSLATAAALVAVVGPITVSAGIQSRRAGEEAERAHREASMAKQLVDFVLSYMTAPPAEVPRVDRMEPIDLIDLGASRARESLDLDPVLRAQLLRGFGEALRRSSQLERAAAPLEEADRVLEATLGPDSPETLAARDSLARLRQEQGKGDEAIRLFRESLQARVEAGGEDDIESLRAAGRLGLCLKLTGRSAEAEEVLGRTIASLREQLGEEDRVVLALESYRIGALLDLGRFPEVIEASERILPLARKTLGPTHIETTAMAYNRACALGHMGHVDAAIGVLTKLIDEGLAAMWMKEDPHLLPLHGDPRLPELFHRTALNTRGYWGTFLGATMGLRTQGQLAASEALARDVLETAERIGAMQSGEAMNFSYNLADVLLLSGRADEAEAIVSRLDQDNLRLGADRPYPEAEFIAIRAQCRLAKGDLAGARAALDEAASRCAKGTHLAIAAYVESRRAALAGDRERAARLLTEATVRGQDLSWWLVREIVADRGAGRWEEAKELSDYLRAWASRWNVPVVQGVL